MVEKATILSTNFTKLDTTVGTQLESIDKKTEDTQNSLKELQQVCANVLKEFHQVRRSLLLHSFTRCSPATQPHSHTQPACHTCIYPTPPCGPHSCAHSPAQVTNTFDDKVGNFSKNLRMEFRSMTKAFSHACCVTKKIVCCCLFSIKCLFIYCECLRSQLSSRHAIFCSGKPRTTW